MTEELYELRDGEMMKFNPETRRWEPEKAPSYSVHIKSKTGTQKISDLTRAQEKNLLKCIVTAKIPVNFKVKPTDGRREADIELKEFEDELNYLTSEKATKIKNCLSPLSELVEVKITKLGDVL